MRDVIVTMLGTDRPGLVEALAGEVARLDGNWLESRMAHLAGKFAGILRVQVPSGRVDDLIAAVRRLERDDLSIVVEGSGVTPSPEAAARTLELDLVGLDRAGIVRDISGVLLRHGANVEELTTDCTSAPMSGEMLFRARMRLSVAPGADLSALRADLERFATDLMVELRLVETVSRRSSAQAR